MMISTSPSHTRQRRQAAKAYPTPHLLGKLMLPGDKSLSHRALILASLAIGQSYVRGLLLSEDVRATATALQALGAHIKKKRHGWHITGCGVGGFRTPKAPLQLGNSGTGLRLLMGASITSPIHTHWRGDASLSARPMARVLEPLQHMGAMAQARRQEFLPISLRAPERALPIGYTIPIPSAQIKSALILAALGAAGQSIITEPVATRDHTERMLPLFRGKIRIRKWRQGRQLMIDGEQDLYPADLEIGGDPSSAAFMMVAASLVPKAHIVVQQCLLNPHRLGAVRALRKMGAHVRQGKARKCGGERMADFTIRHAILRGAHFPAADIPAMIDEIPILAVAAAFAQGRTQFDGLQELRVKESDRLRAIAQGLTANGIRCVIRHNSLIIWGQGPGGVAGGGKVATQRDHRIAMAFLVMGLASQAPVQIDDATMIATSFPDFFHAMRHLGARLDS